MSLPSPREFERKAIRRGDDFARGAGLADTVICKDTTVILLTIYFTTKILVSSNMAFLRVFLCRLTTFLTLVGAEFAGAL